MFAEFEVSLQLSLNILDNIINIHIEISLELLMIECVLLTTCFIGDHSSIAHAHIVSQLGLHVHTYNKST